MKARGWIAAALLLTGLDLNDGLQWWPLSLALGLVGVALAANDTRRRLSAIDHALDGEEL